MRVAVDGHWRNTLSIGRCFREIVARCPEDISVEVIGSDLNFGDPLVPLRLAGAIRRSRCDAFWSPGFIPPAPTQTPSVFMLYDLLQRKFWKRRHRYYYDFFLRPCARRVSRILTLSEYSKGDIEKWLGRGHGDFVQVVHPGVEPLFRPAGPRWEPGFPYILYVGNHFNHKNLPRLVLAFGQATLDPATRLVLTGDENAELREVANGAGVSERVLYLGRVDEAFLRSAYRGALAVALVSLCEGFGLPIVEAMASGTPVLAGSVASMPEVVGNAGVLVDPVDIGAIARGIERIVHDADLREMLRQRGLERSAQYAWDGCAAAVWAAVREVATPA